MLTIQQDLDITERSRAIYTIWDMLGDIGGLFDMLCLLASPLIQFISLIVGSGVDNHLIQLLFK